MKFAIVAATLLISTVAYAEDCPKGASSCKVVTMTPEEIQTLAQPGGVWDQAIWANRSGMTGIIDAWKKKIEQSPNGTIKTEEPAK